MSVKATQRERQYMEHEIARMAEQADLQFHKPSHWHWQVVDPTTGQVLTNVWPTKFKYRHWWPPVNNHQTFEGIECAEVLDGVSEIIAAYQADNESSDKRIEEHLKKRDKENAPRIKITQMRTGSPAGITLPRVDGKKYFTDDVVLDLQDDNELKIVFNGSTYSESLRLPSDLARRVLQRAGELYAYLEAKEGENAETTVSSDDTSDGNGAIARHTQTRRK